MNQPRVFVADIGTTKVAVVSGTINDQGHLKVDGVWVTPCDGVVKGEIRDRDKVIEALREAVERVETDVRSSCDALFVTVGGKGLMSQRTQGFMPIHPPGRAVKRQDVHQVITHSRQVLMPPGTEQIMAIPTEFRLDHQRGIQRPVGMPAARLEVLTHIVTIDTAAIHKIEAVVRAIDREVVGAVPEPLAAALGVATQDNVDIGCVVIDIGGTVTNVAAFDEGVLTHLAAIPVGAAHITSDIAMLVKVDHKTAERLKVEHGYCIAARVNPADVAPIPAHGEEPARQMNRRVLCEIIESRVREIIDLVAISLEQAGVSKNPGSGYLLTGGGSLTQGLEQLFVDIIGNTRTRIVQPKASGGHSREIGTPTMAAAVGLARYALEEEFDDFEPASGQTGWSNAVRTLKSVFGGKS